MTAPSGRPLLRRTPHVLRPDPARVVNKAFLPGQELVGAGRRSRSTAVLERVLDLPDTEVDDALERVMRAFASRHRDLVATLEARFNLVAHLVDRPGGLSSARRRLVGATFSHEYALEAAALFNPSMVAHPDQSDLPAGAVRFVMTVRAVGEGHISSVEFRTGTIEGEVVRFDDAGQVCVPSQVVPASYSRAVFQQQLHELRTEGGGPGDADADVVLGALPATFDRADLDRAIAQLRDPATTGVPATRTIQQLEWVAGCNYATTFPSGSALHERVLLPSSPSEQHGLEDVRFVRHVDEGGEVDYRGTYTAFDGVRVAPQLMRTTDFRTFHVSQLSGPAAKDKGMALFPRPVDGRSLALSRFDRETNALASSEDLSRWEVEAALPSSPGSWAVVQVGNCGPPLETPAGWLVLTHGVGPMREYSISASLLDLDDPTKLLGQLREPLLTPAPDERDGYVPNVVYSCGALLHGDTLVLPYGCSDASIRVALVDVPQLLALLGAPSWSR